MGFIEDQKQEKEVVYDLNYFIEKFIAIPEDQWTVGDFVNRSGQKCALGHCGVAMNPVIKVPTSTVESRALVQLAPYTVQVNDGFDFDLVAPVYSSYGDTPKDRVINYLKEVRDGKT